MMTSKLLLEKKQYLRLVKTVCLTIITRL